MGVMRVPWRSVPTVPLVLVLPEARPVRYASPRRARAGLLDAPGRPSKKLCLETHETNVLPIKAPDDYLELEGSEEVLVVYGVYELS